jgi:hypothetical protein
MKPSAGAARQTGENGGGDLPPSFLELGRFWRVGDYFFE